jgi:hypothetical protein
MENLAAETGAVFDDATEPRRLGIERGDFRDVVHLEEDATVAFSRHIGRVIRANFGAV